MADDVVPSGTFGDYSGSNSNAVTYDGRNSICQRSGRLAKPEELVREWTGLWVLPQYRDFRHPQDFIRTSHETKEGSHATAAPDQFIVNSEPILDELGREIRDYRGGMIFSEATAVTV